MSQYKDYLLSKIDDLLSKRITIDDFDEQFSRFFLELPPNIIKECDYWFFNEIAEKLTMTNKFVSRHDRKDGLISHNDFIIWLKEKYDVYEY